MAIYIANKRKSLQTLSKEYPNARIIDVTSKATDNFVKFSPFFPLGKIPIPFSEGHYAECVEGIWQGLKVFEKQGIDPTRFQIRNMKNLKRTVKKHDPILGHQKGINSTELLKYYDARMQIYLPAYSYVLKNYLLDLIKEIENIAATIPELVLLDYETNTNITDTTKPLSHASLVKNFIENDYTLS